MASLPLHQSPTTCAERRPIYCHAESIGVCQLRFTSSTRTIAPGLPSLGRPWLGIAPSQQRLSHVLIESKGDFFENDFVLE